MMNGETKEIVAAIHDLATEVAVLKGKHENMEKYIFKDLRPDIEKLCKRVEKCMDKSVDERHRDLKWMVTQTATLTIATVGWIAFFVK